MIERKCSKCGFISTNVYPLNRVGDDGAVKNLCGYKEGCNTNKEAAK